MPGTPVIQEVEDRKCLASLGNLARPCVKIKSKSVQGCGSAVDCPKFNHKRATKKEKKQECDAEAHHVPTTLPVLSLPHGCHPLTSEEPNRAHRTFSEPPESWRRGQDRSFLKPTVAVLPKAPAVAKVLGLRSGLYAAASPPCSTWHAGPCEQCLEGNQWATAGSACSLTPTTCGLCLRYSEASPGSMPDCPRSSS